jgi:hypothetical protein
MASVTKQNPVVEQDTELSPSITTTDRFSSVVVITYAEKSDGNEQTTEDDGDDEDRPYNESDSDEEYNEQEDDEYDEDNDPYYYNRGNGYLHCGCIDVCRGRCDEESDW